MPLKLDALDHPKTLDFASRLGVELPTAIGHLELLWAFTGKKSPSGNIGKWPDGAIARACYFMGDPQSFLQSLLQSGLIDAHDTHRYVIHDWQEHAPRWVSAKLKKLNAPFAGNGRTAVATVVATTETSPRARAIPRQGKTREDKASVLEHTDANSDPDSETGADPNHVVEQIRGHYPTGQYRDSAWLKASHFVARRLDEGVGAEQLVDAAARYCDQQRARGKIGTEFVLSPAKFYELTDWRGPFPLPPTKGELRQDENLAASQTWLEGSNAGS